MAPYVLIFAMLFASAFSGVRGQIANAKVEDDIREAVFRYMFEHSVPQQKPYTKVLFISLDKKDPSKEFISRFEGHTPPVRKVSDSEVSGDMSGVKDKKSGEQGILFRVGETKWVSDTEVSVEGHFYVASLFAGACEYRVVLDDGKWAVRGCSKGWQA